MNYYRNSGFFSNVPPVTKNLILINAGVFLLQMIVPAIVQFFAVSRWGMTHFLLWQPFTYMFLHGGMGHLFFNMFALFIIGAPFEQTIGSKAYLKYYLTCGVGAGIFIVLVDFITGNSYPTLGASGAVYAVLLGYGLFYPDQYMILLFPPIPIKVKWLVLIMGGISFFSMFFSQGSISHSGHLGGLITGMIYFLLNRRNYVFRPGNNTLSQAKNRVLELLHIKNKMKIIHPDSRKFFFHKKDDEQLNPDEMTDYQIEEKIDKLLDKIKQKGVKSLSIEEQLFLDKISVRYKHKFPH